MIRKFLLALFGLLVILGILAGIKVLQIRAMIDAGKAFQMPPEAITSAVVQPQTWQPTLAAAGTISAVQGITLRAELAGTVREISFDSGGNAREGQVLVQLDTSSEDAQLRAAEAEAELARLTLDRSRDLRVKSTISQSEFDSAQASFQQAVARADNIRAVIDKKTVRAPFAGKLGIRTVNLGQFVNAGDPIVSLHSLDPVYADFNLPEQRISELERNLPVRVTSDAVAGRSFNGTLTAFNPDIDPATRNVRIQATLPNPDGALRPGMFAKVEVILPKPREVLAIPATAILHAPYGDSVFVIQDVKDEKTGQTSRQVRMTTVRLGESRGDLVEVTRGLEAGQEVATTGVFKLRNGSPVMVNNALAPDAQEAPTPADS